MPLPIEVRDLQILEAINHHGTFAKAAAHLNRTPSAITQSVQKLEDLLGFLIFDREHYRPTLTSEGRLFIERGQVILKQMEKLQHDLPLIKKGWDSEFSLSFDDLLSTTGVFSLIKDFQKIAPHVTIRLHREVLNGCWDALAHHRSSLVLGASGEVPLGLSSAEKPLGNINFVFAVAAHHPLAASLAPLTHEDIAVHCSIVISDTSQHFSARSSGVFQGQTTIVVPNMEAKILAQVQGLGVGYLPRHRIKDLLKNGSLIERSVLAHQKSNTHLKIAWRSDMQSAILDWFLAELNKDEVKNRLLS